MNLGKVLGYEPEADSVNLFFQNGRGRLVFIGDRTVRVFTGPEGARGESFAVTGARKNKKTELSLVQQKGNIIVRTRRMTVRVRDDFQVDFLTPSGAEVSTQLPVPEDFAHAVSLRRTLYEGERIYGLGDKPGFLDRRGYEWIMWNSDIPDPHVDYMPSLYKSIPFFISLRRDHCYGIFFDNPAKSWFDMGKTDPGSYTIAADTGNLDYYYFWGETPKDVLAAYTRLTGTTPLPQLWTLGYHQSRWSYETREEVLSVAGNLRKHRIPCDAIHLDIDYMDGYRVFTWNKSYKDPKADMEQLARLGFKPVTIVDPGVKVDPEYRVYREGAQKGYFARKDGKIYSNWVWPGEAVYPGFTAPAVRKWWGEQHAFLTGLGIKGIWNDMNEPASFHGPLPDDVEFPAGGTKTMLHRDIHNVYGHCMAQATFEGLQRLDPKARPFIITRACYAGTQKYATVWTGDNQSIWAHLQMAVPQLCSLGLGGFAMAGTDVGGFGADATKELMARWVQVGCLSPLFRNHSAKGTRRQEPWTFDTELLSIYRRYVELRYRLLPYIYDCFFACEDTGMPPMRPLVLNFPKDEETWSMNDEFMLGDWLLAAPVMTQGARCRQVYLPSGAAWYDFWTGEKYSGGQYILKTAELDVMPLYVKAGAVLPLWPLMQFVGERPVEELTLAVYPGNGNYLHYLDDGTSYGYREGKYNAYLFAQNNGRMQIKQAVRGAENAYRGFNVKIMKGGVTALSPDEGEFLDAAKID